MVGYAPPPPPPPPPPPCQQVYAPVAVPLFDRLCRLWLPKHFFSQFVSMLSYHQLLYQQLLPPCTHNMPIIIMIPVDHSLHGYPQMTFILLITCVGVCRSNWMWRELFCSVVSRTFLRSRLVRAFVPRDWGRTWCCYSSTTNLVHSLLLSFNRPQPTKSEGMRALGV